MVKGFFDDSNMRIGKVVREIASSSSSSEKSTFTGTQRVEFCIGTLPECGSACGEGS